MNPRLAVAAGVLLPVWLVPGLHCSRAAAGAGVPPKSTVATPTATPDAFVSTVRPILLAHCAPCHEPGGVMYGRLPFDQSGVVASHSAGVLRRMKVPEEKAAIERWLAALPKPAAQGR